MTVMQRCFGRSGPPVSVVTFGSMRFPTALTTVEAARFLGEIWDAGVTTLHSSHEYATHEAFCAAMRRLRQERPDVRPVHVSKIAVPHFEDPAGFAPALLRERVERQLEDLGTDRLEIVQWLLRSKPIADDSRMRILESARGELEETWRKLQQEGKVGLLASFPYSMPFAREVLRRDPCRGLVTYLNATELEAVPLLSEMQQQGAGFIAIRPLAAGRLTERLWTADVPADAPLRDALGTLGVGPADVVRFALRFPLLHPVVASVMVSVSSPEHLAEVVEATEDCAEDESRFRKIVERLLAAE